MPSCMPDVPLAEVSQQVKASQVRQPPAECQPRTADFGIAAFQAQSHGEIAVYAVEGKHARRSRRGALDSSGTCRIQVEADQIHQMALRQRSPSFQISAVTGSRSYRRLTKCSRQYCWQSMTRASSSRWIE